MKKRTISIFVCLCMLFGILAGSGITVGAAATQPEVVGTTVSNWGAHSYIACDEDATQVTSNLTANADGSITISGDQVGPGLGIGVTNTEPIYLDQGGFTLDMSFDTWDTSSNDVWFALYLSDKKTVTNANNADPVFRGWDNVGDYDYNEGRGFILIIRPDGNGKMRYQWFYNGVTSNANPAPANNQLVSCDMGCFVYVTLNRGNYESVKLTLQKKDGGYNLILNDGEFTRNGGDRIETNGAINPHQPLALLDAIFPTGTPCYVKVLASNANNAETAFSINSFNGVFANQENTLESWGVHNYVAGDGSQLENTIEATDTGDLVVKGYQAAGDGELGVTYACPIDIENGLSIEFSLDEYVVNGQNGADSWLALQIKDNLTVTDAQNPDGVYHKLDIGGGNPDYGSGWHILIRPNADNTLGIGEIYYCGVDASGNVTKNWSWDANGCYSSLKVDSFEHIKIALVPGSGGSMNIVVNDGDYIRVDGDRSDSDGRINVANGYAFFRNYFSTSRKAYVALSYHHNQNNANSQFTIHSINGQQAVANTANSWGAHNYVALDGSEVISNMKVDETGSVIISGNQTAGHGAIGATWKRPIDMSDGISVEFSLDSYTAHGLYGTDTWLGLQLLHQETITDGMNPDGAYRQFEAGNGDYGDGLVMLIRPMENNTLRVGEIYINGAKVDGTIVKSNFQNVANGGCYDTIQVPSFQNIKVDILPNADGSFRIVFNDGDYIRVGADRLSNDHGKINVNEGFAWLKSFFTDETPAYLKLAYKCTAGVEAQFTVHKVNEIAAAEPEVVVDVPVTDGVYELLNDTKFENGFKVHANLKSELSTGYGYFNYGNSALRPTWTVAQWDTKYDFRDMENNTLFMETDDGVYVYDSIDKVLTVDTNTGTLGMELNASEVYDDPRTAGEVWPHLLIEGSTKNAEAPFANKAVNMEHLRLQLSTRLTKFEDHMGEDADTSLHAGSFYIYIYVKGTNETGATEMTWFGLTFFDNRFTMTAESGMKDGGKDDASGLFIYQVASRGFTYTDFVEDGAIVANEDSEWMDIDIDLLPYIERCLVLAQERGFMKGVTMDSVFVDGMNMGWEMPGTYDGKMEVKDMSLKSYVGTTYEHNNGIYNLYVPDMAETESIVVDDTLSMTVPKEVVIMDGIEQAMLQIQAIKRDSLDGITIEGYDVTDAYDIGLWINGNAYTSKLDTDVELVYKAESGNIGDLKFYTFTSSGTPKLLEGTYDAAANTFTCTVNRMALLAVATEAEVEDPEIPATGDDILLSIAAALVAGLSLVALLPKQRKN